MHVRKHLIPGQQLLFLGSMKYINTEVEASFTECKNFVELMYNHQHHYYLLLTSLFPFFAVLNSSHSLKAHLTR